MKLSYEDIVDKIQLELPTHHNFKSKVGMRVHNLTVMYFAGRYATNGGQKCTKYICLCDCGNYTIVDGGGLRPNFTKGIVSCGCVRDYKKLVTQETIDKRIVRLEEETPYKVIDPCGGKFDDKWELLCDKHGMFKSAWGDVVVAGTRCPSCACISRGFNQMIPAFFYLNLVSDHGQPLAIKYGITNSTVDKRLTWLRFGTDYDIDNIFKVKFLLGRDALSLETEFSRKFGKHFLSKEELTTGFSETVSHENLDTYLNWVDDYIKKNNLTLFKSNSFR